MRGARLVPLNHPHRVEFIDGGALPTPKDGLNPAA